MSPDMERSRRYIFYEFRGWEPAYLPEMIEYQVDGHSWYPSNWEATGMVYYPVEEVTDNPVDVSEYSYNTTAKLIY